MANQEHLEILKKGAKDWNSWRENNPSIVPNLERARLGAIYPDYDESIPAIYTRLDLHAVNLHGADFRSSSLYGANLHGADLSGSHLSEVDFSDADLSNANLT